MLSKADLQKYLKWGEELPRPIRQEIEEQTVHQKMEEAWLPFIDRFVQDHKHVVYKDKHLKLLHKYSKSLRQRLITEENPNSLSERLYALAPVHPPKYASNQVREYKNRFLYKLGLSDIQTPESKGSRGSRGSIRSLTSASLKNLHMRSGSCYPQRGSVKEEKISIMDKIVRYADKGMQKQQILELIRENYIPDKHRERDTPARPKRKSQWDYEDYPPPTTAKVRQFATFLNIYEQKFGERDGSEFDSSHIRKKHRKSETLPVQEIRGQLKPKKGMHEMDFMKNRISILAQNRDIYLELNAKINKKINGHTEIPSRNLGKIQNEGSFSHIIQNNLDEKPPGMVVKAGRSESLKEIRNPNAEGQGGILIKIHPVGPVTGKDGIKSTNRLNIPFQFVEENNRGKRKSVLMTHLSSGSILTNYTNSSPNTESVRRSRMSTLDSQAQMKYRISNNIAGIKQKRIQTIKLTKLNLRQDLDEMENFLKPRTPLQNIHIGVMKKGKDSESASLYRRIVSESLPNSPLFCSTSRVTQLTNRSPSVIKIPLHVLNKNNDIEEKIKRMRERFSINNIENDFLRRDTKLLYPMQFARTALQKKFLAPSQIN